MNVTLSEAVDEFLRIRAAKVSAGTVRGDDQTMRKLLAHAGNVRMYSLDAEKLGDFFYGPGGLINVGGHGGSGVENATFNCHRARLKVFVEWAQNKGYMKKGSNPLYDIDRRKSQARPERQRLTSSEIREGALLARTERDTFLWMLTACSALRTSSVQSLRYEQVDLKAGYLRNVWMKGDKYITLPIARDLETATRKWLDVYQNECGAIQGDWFMVPTARRGGYVSTPDGRINSGTYSYRPEKPLLHPAQVVKAILDQMGLDGRGEGMHTLRRSGARILFETLLANGDNRAIHTVREFLGHASITMTELYIGTTSERVRLDEILRGKDFLQDTAQAATPTGVASLAAAREKRNSRDA